MPLLKTLARKKRLNYFIKPIPKYSHVLEVGCGTGWLGRYMAVNGWEHYTGIDLLPPADIVGNITQWQQLGLLPLSFDYIIAFEVVEHANIFQSCYDLLKNEGRLLVTTPLPHMDWLLKLLENMGLNQKRTSPHNHLIYLSKLELFTPVELKKVGGMAQWAVLRKNI